MQPRFLLDYAELYLEDPAAVRQLAVASLIGTAMIGRVADRPKSWERRTLNQEGLREVEAIRSVFERVWPLRKSPTTTIRSHILVGQSGNNDIVVPEQTISSHHCAFMFESYRMRVVDLDSLNGTRVNQDWIAPYEPTTLCDDDELTVGRVKCRYLNRKSFIRLVARLATELESYDFEFYDVDDDSAAA